MKADDGDGLMMLSLPLIQMLMKTADDVKIQMWEQQLLNLLTLNVVEML
jgi:hypothetical protein